MRWAPTTRQSRAPSSALRCCISARETTGGPNRYINALSQSVKMRLHQALGFVETGRMGKVGYKFERWIGIVMMQKSLR